MSRREIQWKEKNGSGLRNSWILLVLGTLLILMMVGVWFYLQKTYLFKRIASEKTLSVSLEDLSDTLQTILDEHGVSWRRLDQNNSQEDVWHVWVPTDLPVPSLHLAIQEEIHRIGAQVLFAKSEPISKEVSLQIGQSDSCLLCVNLIPIKNEPRNEGKIALLIDDFGDRWDNFVKYFLDLRCDITISILPGRRYSAKIAREGIQRGCEVILHLPMEPMNSSYQDDGHIVLTKMSRQEIREVIQRSLYEVPGAVGINNHMGSRVTSDTQAITNVLKEVEKRNLYFLDSRTTTSSVAYEVAQLQGLRCGKRDVFLDVENEKETIRKRLWDLAKKAKANGFSIGLGHCQKTTLEILRQEIPKIQAKGFRFVPLSKVVR